MGQIIHCRQGTQEWFEARCGRVTASDIVAVLSLLKRGEKAGGDTEKRADYKAALVAEMLTGEPDMEGYVNSFMNRGVEEEPLSRAAYEIVSNVEVEQVGFILHPTIERAGASPDGLVGADGCLELKNPKKSTHIKYMLTGQLPEEYEPQVMFQLACSEREWCDFVSFHSGMPLRHQMFIKRVYRNEQRIAFINDAVVQILGEVDDIIARLDALNPETPLKEQLRRSVVIEDGITDDDLPKWAREMQAK